MFGNRMVGSWSDMNQGSQTGKGTAFMTDQRTEELYPGGDRASAVAKKRGNARGVKGGSITWRLSGGTEAMEPEGAKEEAEEVL